MRVLLVSANPERVPYPVFPVGIAYVAAALEPDHEVRLFDLVADGEDRLPEVLESFAPDLVGLGLRNVDDTRPEGRTYVATYRRMAATIRAHSAAPLVLGGAAFTLFPTRFLAELGADYGLVGAGEHLRPLVDALEAGEEPEGARDGRGVPGLHRPGVPPSPSEPCAAPARVGRAAEELCARYQRLGGMVGVQTKRGCPFRCVYCTYPQVEGRSVLNHPVAAIADDVERLKAAGARYFFFVDSVLNVDLDHTARLAEELIRREVGVPWGAFLAPHRIPVDYARLLAASGLTHAELGTEALSDPVLRAYGKPFSVAEVFEAHDALGTAGVHRAHFLLLGGPGETEDTVEETLATAARLPKTVFFPYAGMRVFPGTPLHRRALDEGVVATEDPLFDPVFYHSPDLDPEWLQERLRRASEASANVVLQDELEEKAGFVARLHARGRTGPRWEHLCR